MRHYEYFVPERVTTDDIKALEREERGVSRGRSSKALWKRQSVMLTTWWLTKQQSLTVFALITSKSWVSVWFEALTGLWSEFCYVHDNSTELVSLLVSQCIGVRIIVGFTPERVGCCDEKTRFSLVICYKSFAPSYLRFRKREKQVCCYWALSLFSLIETQLQDLSELKTQG